MKMHPSWSAMSIGLFGKTHGYCPLCASYHDLHTDGGLIYCIESDINMSGWDLTLYNKLATNPQSIDINEYTDVKYRLIRNKLIKTLPMIIERREALISRVEKAKEDNVKEVKVIVQQPRFRGGDWNRAADYMGLP